MSHNHESPRETDHEHPHHELPAVSLGVEVIRRLFDQETPGSDELFRSHPYEDITPRTFLSRAFAGSVDGVPVSSLPGNTQTARFGTEQLISQILGPTQRTMSGDTNDGPTAEYSTDPSSLTHVEESGSRQMVHAGRKADQNRRATARGTLILRPATVDAIREERTENDDVLATARIGAIQAVKHTWETVPTCHQTPVTNVDTGFEFNQSAVTMSVTVETVGTTSCERQALEGVTTGLNTLWEMVKAAEKDDDGEYPVARLEDVRVTEKEILDS